MGGFSLNGSLNLEHYSMWKAWNRGNAACEDSLRGKGDI